MPAGNDFEPVVFQQHPKLKPIKTRLRRLGADPAMLTGSGSALYGIFSTREELERAIPQFQKEEVIPFAFVSRGSYRARWRRRLDRCARRLTKQGEHKGAGFRNTQHLIQATYFLCSELDLDPR